MQYMSVRLQINSALYKKSSCGLSNGLYLKKEEIILQGSKNTCKASGKF